MNFFITGNSAVEAGLNLGFISPVNAKAGNFASKGQTLKQSYSIAQNIFRLVGKDKINFVLIGLTADSLFRDENETLTENVFEENFQALNDYIKLCRDNGANPLGIIFPFAPSVRQHYRETFFKPLLDILAAFGVKIVNFFDLEVLKEDFSDETHSTKDGAIKLSIVLTLNLREQGFFSDEDFSRMPYNYFNVLSYILDKKFFNELMAKNFSYSVEKIRRKKKIKVAFVTDQASTWCGDRLYNLFAQNPRFETTVFITKGDLYSLESAVHDFEQLKARGLNVVGVFNFYEETEPQDIIFFLRPYMINFSKNFQFNVLTPQTLLIYIPYYISTTPGIVPNFYDIPIFHLAWKYFFETELSQEIFNENSRIETFSGAISGLPKLDLFFEDANKLSFPWKMTRPDAKKIIWAPHWSFVRYGDEKRGATGTFPYNFQFMYELAKAHPEISWVVKPHQRLVVEAVRSGLFSSLEAYEEYLRKWNDLPNAQVYTGGYYQAIFATSDGMIHDSCSFIAEYQYANKPMIFLLNNDELAFTPLGKKILNASYVVDGKNLDDIAFAIQTIFIEGNDALKAERHKVFDEELNYYRRNKMLASDFIYKNVVDELNL